MNRSEIVKRIACAGILAAAAVPLGLSVSSGVRFTASFVRPASIKSWGTTTGALECVFHAIRARVPEGVTAYVHGPTHTLTVRLAELSTPWLEPQEASTSTAPWKLSLHVVPDDRQCHGYVLTVRHA